MTFSELSTPAALVDLPLMKSNIERMQARMTALKVRFRPHVKTSKCMAIVADQIQAGASGITVSTLKEAEQFFAQGITDIMYAVGMVPHKLPQALKLIEAGCQLKLIVDSVAAAQAIAACKISSASKIEVFIEVDTDGHRSGVKPADPLLLEIAAALENRPSASKPTGFASVSGNAAGAAPAAQGASAARLAGVMTHAGGSYDLNTPEALMNMAEQERARCVQAAELLRQAGYACPEVSVGSTPTALSATQLAGVTEVRAGVYVFFDLVMSNVGVCAAQDIALSVLTTVIGHQVDKGWAIVDAGWMAMSRDRGTQKQSTDYGYGQVCDVEGRVLPGFIMEQANQEHGIIALSTGKDLDIAKRFPVGSQLRVLPNHACATGAQFPDYVAVEGQQVRATWPRFYGW
jgi:D-serine deaminase-like pyridoxal phosphate-dependent protein